MRSPKMFLTMLTAGAVVIGAAGTVASAAIPDAGGEIHACYDKTSGLARIYDSQTNAPKSCGANEKTLTWNQKGPQGPQGPAGD